MPKSNIRKRCGKQEWDIHPYNPSQVHESFP